MPDTLTTSAFYTARPSLTLDGDIEATLAEGLVSLVVEETIEGLYRCEFTVGNWDTVNADPGYLYRDRSLLDFGKPLEVRAGDGESGGRLFSGRISALEGRYPPNAPPEMVVLAEDGLQDLRMTRRTRTFDDVTVDDVVSQIASDHGLSSDVQLSSPTYRVLAQVNQSDLAFIRECARNADGEVWLDDGTVHVESRTNRRLDELTLTYGRTLREISVLADIATQRTSVRVSGWDVSAKEAVDYEATVSTLQNELNGDVSGSSALETAFAQRAERLVHCVPFNEQEAQSVAEAEFRRMGRRFLTGSALAEGDARIRVGARLKLLGLGALFEGTYDVVATMHVFDEHGFTTRFRVERAGLSAA